MRALAAELRGEIDGICIEYHYFKNENVIEKAKEIIPTIQKFCTGFLQGNSYGISEEEYQKVLRKEEAIARCIKRLCGSNRAGRCGLDHRHIGLWTTRIN